MDVRAKRDADAASDHQLMVAILKLKLKSYRDRADKPHFKFNTTFLWCSKIKEDFNCAVKNRYEALSSLADDTVEETVEQKWLGIQELWKSTCTDILGRRKNEQKEWITTETWAKIEDRKEIKQKINKCKDEKEKINLRTHYCEVNRMVRKSAKEDKRQFTQEMIEEAETAARQGKIKRLYEVTRTLSGKNINPIKPVKDKVGNILTSDTEQRDRWVQHFDDILNHPLSSNIPDIPPANHLLDVCTDPPTRLETIRAIKSMKNGKAAGPDGIPPKALEVDPAISADILHPLQIWEEEIIPSNWKLGYLITLPKKGNLTQCNNWRGIMLLSVPSKVLTRIILERLRDALDKKLGQEQAGFRQDRSCTDHIATLRIIIEQSIEWQTPLYMTFVDFEKAFDKTIQRLHQSGNTQGKANKTIHNDDGSKTGMYAIANDILDGNRLDHAEGHKKRHRNPVEFYKKVGGS
ncbi:uncharacterized protein LOC131956194 [Physella acuta]|uniref:uncharacterized protein LOC131956194 n=1 Tax=Physella acuta TaxID=109671 RepID=UPI0027DC2681|nr:uncharacterized protein LOC131956194 [Physella acuta]